MKNILGREPALWIALIAGIVAALVGFRIPGLSAGQGSAVVAFIGACLIAYATRPATPAIFTAIVTAAVALTAQYGLELSEELTSSLTGLVLVVFAFVTRGQVIPKAGASAPLPALIAQVDPWPDAEKSSARRA
jgi:hypothetical protein